MKAYRLYVNNEIVGTYLSLPQAMSAMNEWIAAGPTSGHISDEIDLKIENYED